MESERWHRERSSLLRVIPNLLLYSKREWQLSEPMNNKNKKLIIILRGKMAATRCLVDTTLYADTVEWCKDRLHGDTLACGTYQLEETSMQRLGGINLYTLNEDKKGLQ